jgi:predicted phage terminase large subunit-like protein
LDLLHGKWEAPDLERQFIAFWNKWRNGVNGRRTNGAYIEDKASGTGLIQSIKHKGVPVIPYEPEKDKLTRVMDVSPYIESGLLYLPMSKDFDISKKVVNECVAFTADDSHAHDDIVDCMTMALNLAYRKTPMKIAPDWEIASEMINNDL